MEYLATPMSVPGGPSGRRCWSELPPELLQLISAKVAEIGDYVRFGAVCKPWLSAASPVANLPPQIPWLLLPYDPADTLRCFFSLSSRRIYRFDLPNFRWRIISSSSAGWLIMVDASFLISLLNPITQAHIQLPPLPTRLIRMYHSLRTTLDSLSVNQNGSIDPKFQLAIQGAFHGALRCYSFMSQDGEHIVAIVAMSFHFLYCRVQDKTWITVDRAIESSIKTVAYHGDIFYIVYQNGEVAVCELSPGAKPTSVRTLHVPVDFYYCYLVPVAGELLMLTCLLGNAQSKQHFHCFKLDSIEQLKWSRINDIGQCSLFFKGKVGIVAAAVGESSGCRRNYIYNLDRLGRASPVQQLYGSSLQGDNVELISDLEVEYNPKQLQPIWFMPSL